MAETEGLKIDIKTLVEDILQLGFFYDYFDNQKYLYVTFNGIINFKHTFYPKDRPCSIRFYCDKDVIEEYDMTDKLITINQTEINKYVSGF